MTHEAILTSSLPCSPSLGQANGKIHQFWFGKTLLNSRITKVIRVELPNSCVTMVLAKRHITWGVYGDLAIF